MSRTPASPPRRSYRAFVQASVEILAQLGRLNHDAAGSIAAVVALMILMAYWILRT